MGEEYSITECLIHQKILRRFGLYHQQYPEREPNLYFVGLDPDLWMRLYTPISGTGEKHSTGFRPVFKIDRKARAAYE
jgi:hypothetical protein